MKDRIFAFIGTGNMGGALARAARQAVPGQNILLANRTREKAERLAADSNMDGKITSLDYVRVKNTIMGR